MKCPACGKTLAIPAADLARLKAGGRRAACPACKSPIDIGNAVQVASGPSTGGTMKLAISPGGTGQYGLAAEQGLNAGGTAGFSPLGGSSGGHARPPAPQPERGGTMAMSAPGGQTPPPVPGQASPPSRAGSGTIIERTLPRPDHTTAARDIFNTLDNAGPKASASPNRGRSAESPERGPDRTRIWIAAGAATAAGLLMVVVTTLFFMWISKKDTDSPPSGQTAQTDPHPPTDSRTSENSSLPPETETKRARPTSGSATPKKSAAAPDLQTARANQPPRNEASDQAPATLEPALSNQPDSAPVSHSTPLTKAAMAAANSAPPPAPASMFAANNFNIARMPKRPRQPEYQTGKNLDKAKSFGEGFVIPAGMYRIRHSSQDNRAGARKYTVIECSVQEKGRALAMTEHGSSDFEVEPQLAHKLDRLPGRFLAQSVAILTLWIDNSGKCGVVCAELLEKCEPRLKPGFGIGQADVDYHVRFLSPAEDKTGKAPDEDWQKVGRMNHFYTHWKHHVDGLRKRQQTASMAALTNTMGSMYSNAMKGVAADAASEAARQRAINGR